MGRRLLILLLAGTTGCSFAFVDKPPSPRCTQSRTMAVVDLATAAAALLLGTAVTFFLATEGSNSDSGLYGTDAVPYGVATAVVTGGYGMSAGHGFAHTADCRAAARRR